MPDRHGETSSFPASADQFAIKVPFDSTQPLGNQANNSLEKASHIIHYFDAIYNIENYLLGQVGSSVVSRYTSGVSGADEDVFGSNLQIAYLTLTSTMTGDTLTISSSVPSLMGSNPFDSPGFAVGHNTYFFSPSSTGTTEGLWAGSNYSSQESSNASMRWFQPFTMVYPTSGQNFTVEIKNYQLHSSSNAIDGSFTDNLKTTLGDYLALTSRTSWTGYQNTISAMYTQFIDSSAYLIMYSEIGNDPAYGYAIPGPGVCPVSADGYVEWGEIVDRFATPETGNECYTRVGPMVRVIGTSATDLSFYAVAIGDVPLTASGLVGDPGKYGRIIKVENVNLGVTLGDPDGGGIPWGTGTVTDLGSGYFWFGDLATRYRLKVVGNAITVESASSPFSSFSTLYGPFTDPSPLASGSVNSTGGFFSKAMDGDDNRWVKFLGDIKVVPLSSNREYPNVYVQLMFVKIGPDASVPLENE